MTWPTWLLTTPDGLWWAGVGLVGGVMAGLFGYALLKVVGALLVAWLDVWREG